MFEYYALIETAYPTWLLWILHLLDILTKISIIVLAGNKIIKYVKSANNVSGLVDELKTGVKELVEMVNNKKTGKDKTR